MVYFARIIFANFAFQEKTQKIVGVSNKEGVVQGGSELTYETPRLPSYYMRVRFKMSSSLYKYFKREAKGEEEPSKDGLPDPKGELSGKVPLSSILSANKEVRQFSMLQSQESASEVHMTALLLKKKQ